MLEGLGKGKLKLGRLDVRLLQEPRNTPVCVWCGVCVCSFMCNGMEVIRKINSKMAHPSTSAHL